MAPPGIGSHHLHDVSSIATRLKDHEKRKEARRVMQMRSARERARLMKEAKAAEAAKEEGTITEEGNGHAMAVDEEEAGHGEKRKLAASDEDRSAKKLHVDADATGTGGIVASEDVEEDEQEAEASEDYYSARYNEPAMPWSSVTFTKPSTEMRGHTSYLTFATFYPASIRAKLASQESEPATRRGTPSTRAETEVPTTTTE